MQETWLQSLGQEDPLEEAMANPSSILAWKNQWTEEPKRLQSMESQRVGHTERLTLSQVFSTKQKYIEVGDLWELTLGKC